MAWAGEGNLVIKLVGLHFALTKFIVLFRLFFS